MLFPKKKKGKKYTLIHYKMVLMQSRILRWGVSMGIRSLPLISFSLHPKSSVYQNQRPYYSCSDLPTSSSAGAAPRALWDSEVETFRGERLGSAPKLGSACDVDARSEFRTREKRTKWWSDEEEEEDDEDQDLFGLLQEPKTTDFVFKVLGAVGWIMPNIIMSSMLDTGDKGQDALFMALMIPLGQLAISLVVDKIQGSSENPRRKRKKKPFSRITSRTRLSNKTRKRSYRTSHPWWETDSSFSNNGTKSSSSFGGWDELDQQVDNVSSFHVLSPREDDNIKKESKVQID